MTNLRDALEKAAKLSSQAETDAGADVDTDRDVQAFADHVSAPSEPSNHPAIDEDRPKLIENEDEFSSVADRISQLVSGESQPTNEADEWAVSTEEQNDVDPPIAEQMQTAAELTGDAWQLDAIDETDNDSSTSDAPATTEFDPDSSNYAAEIKTIDDVANTLEPEQDTSSYEQEFASFDPLGLDEQLAIIDEDLQEVEDDTFTESLESPNDNQEVLADSDEHDAPDECDVHEALEDDTGEWELLEDESETRSEFEVLKTDTGTFDPGVIPALRPGNAISTVTTEDEVRDPVTSANKLTGAYLPEDLNRVHYSDYVDKDGEEDFDTESISSVAASLTNTSETATTGEKPTFLQTTNLQVQPEPETDDDIEDVDDLKYVNAALATAAAAAAAVGMGAAIGQANASDNVDAEDSVEQFVSETSDPFDTKELETNAFEDEYSKNEPAAPSRPGQPVVGNEHPIPERSTPTLPSLTVSSRSSSKFYEQRILENLTNSPNALEYNDLAKGILTSDSNIAPKTICFISADEESHAPDVISHVGVVLTTLNEKRVLLVDANDCPNNISRLFDKDKQPGLKNIPNINEDWLDMVLPTDVPNLFVLPAGWNHSEMEWQAGEFGGLISLFARQFDIILVDAGVAESTEDTPFYAAHDRTLMILRLGQTDREMATAVRKGLKKSDVQLNGCVITNLPA